MKLVVERYLAAGFAFVVAAVWAGVGLVSAFECLLAFALASLVVGVVQRRRVVESSRGGRAGARRPGERRARPGDPADETRRHSRDGARPSRALYDDEVAGDEWPRLAERRW